MSFKKWCFKKTEKKVKDGAAMQRSLKAVCVAVSLAVGSISCINAAQEQAIILEGAAVSLENETGIEAESVYIRAAGSRDWGEDVLSGLSALSLTEASYDLRIVGEGGEAVFVGLPLASASSIRLFEENGYTYAETVDMQGSTSSSIHVKTSTYPVLSQVVTQNTNVRTSDSKEGTLLRSIKVGEQVEVYGQTSNTDRKWVMIWLDGHYAYCIGDYLDPLEAESLPQPDQVSETDSSQAEPAAQSPQAEQGSGYTDAMMALGSSMPSNDGQDGLLSYTAPAAMKVTRNIKVRSGPGTDYQQVGSLKEGSETTAYGEIMTERKWSQVMYNGVLYYCISDYLEPVGEAPQIAADAASDDMALEQGQEETKETPAAENEIEEASFAEMETEETTEETPATEIEAEEDTAAETEAEDTAAETEIEEDTAAETEIEEDTAAETEIEEDTAAETEIEEDTAAETEIEDNTAEETQMEESTPALTEEETVFTTENDLEVSSLEESTEAAESLETESLDEEDLGEAAQYGPSLEELQQQPRTLKKVETYSSIRRPGHGYRFMLFSDGTIEVQLY